MGKKVKSARGEIVDFDLLKIKEQIAAAPPSVDVQQRRDFVERRLRRRMKKPVVVETTQEMNVEPNMPLPEEDQYDMVEEPVVTTEVEPETKSKQRARPRKS